jgi:YHS domain-containing protein
MMDQFEFKDPVCGVMVTDGNAGGLRVYRGRMLYFCSKEHREMFERDPEKYLKNDEGRGPRLLDESQVQKSY